MESTESRIWVDTSGRRITDAAVRRGLRTSVIASMLGVAWWVMVQGIPLTLFLEALGASGVMMGLATTVIQFAFVMMLPGAILVRKLKARKRLWGAVVLVSRAIWFVPVFLAAEFADRPDLIAWATVLLCAVSAGLGNAVSALWFSWMANLIPARMVGRFWGTRQSVTMISYLVAMWFAGHLLDLFPPPSHGGSWKGFSLVFAIGAVLGVLDIIIHLSVPEPRLEEKPEAGGLLKDILAPLKSRDFTLLTVGMGVYSFAMGLVSLGLVYLKQDFHMNYSHLSALAIASSLGTLAFGVAWGYVMDRIGGRAFAALMMITAPLLGFVWFFTEDYSVDFGTLAGAIPFLGKPVAAVMSLLPHGWQEWIASKHLPQALWLHIAAGFIAGALYGGIGVAQLNLVSVLSSRESRTMAMAVHWSIVGTIGSLGAILGGRVMDYFKEHPLSYQLPTGTQLSFFHFLVVAQIAIIWCVVLPMLIRIRRGRDEPQVLRAFSQVFAVNPFRMVTNIYLMGASVSSRKRAMAVRGLGWGQNAIAVKDLVERLNDPSSEVREEAALALGSIGTPEAVEALAEKLNDASSDLAAFCARAIRIAYSPSGGGRGHHPGVHETGALLASKLETADTETCVECIRALGVLGYSESVGYITGLLSSSNDLRLMCAAAEALGKMDDISAAGPLIEKMAAEKEGLFRRTLSTSIADLIGERDVFYKILAREIQQKGRAVPGLFDELRGRIKRLKKRLGQDMADRIEERIRQARQALEEDDYQACAGLLVGIHGLLSEAAVRPHDAEPGSGEEDRRRIRFCSKYILAFEGDWVALNDSHIMLGLYLLCSSGILEPHNYKT